jgi:AcrR family transcriptional regulator
MFLERGYHCTTMSAISSALGGSKSTLWTHFGSKEELFEAVIVQAVEDFQARLQMEFKRKGQVSDILLTFAERYISKVESPTALRLQRLAISECEHIPNVGNIVYERATRPTRELLRDYLEQQMLLGKLKRDDAMAAAEALMSLCAGVTLHAALFNAKHSDANDVSRRARDAVTRFMLIWGT